MSKLLQRQAILAFAFVLLAVNSFALIPNILDFNVNTDINYTNSTSATLYLYGDANVSTMCFSETSYSNPSDCPSFVAYSNTSAFTLSSGDGMKTVYAYVKSSDLNTASDSDTILLDTNKPSTSADVNSSKGYSSTITITLTCSDGSGASGCDVTAYRLDSDASDSVSMGSWIAGNSINTAVFGSDGNYAIDFNSTDKAGNIESTKQAYFLRDFGDKPVVSIILPVNGSSTTSNLIVFDVNDGISPINVSGISIDVNGSSADFNANACVSNAGNPQSYHCIVWTSRFDTNYADYNVGIIAADSAGNQSVKVNSVFKYIDGAAPAQLSKPTCASAGSAISVSWNKSTEFDISNYRIYRGIISGFGTGDANWVKTVQHSSCTSGSSCSATDDNSIVQGQNYYYKIAPADKSGNAGTASDASDACVATGGIGSPSISSSTHSTGSWSNKKDVNISWNSVSSATVYYWALDQNSNTVPDSNFTTITGLFFSSLADASWYVHVRACSTVSTSTCGSTTHFNAKIDTVSPSTPSNLDVSVDGSALKLSWTSSSDSLSGIEKYYIYRSTSSGVSTSSVYASTTSTSYADSSVSSGTTYYYVVKSKDNAGNESGTSNEDSANAGGAFSITISAPSYAKAETLTISVSSSGGSMVDAMLSIQKPSGSIETLASDVDGSSFSRTYSFSSGSDGTYTVKVEAKDSAGNSYTKTRTIVIDTIQPTVQWVNPAFSAVLTGDTRLTARAIDSGAGIKNVAFYYGSIFISSTSVVDNEQYAIDWSLVNVPNGTHVLKAIAADLSGNTKEITQTVSVNRVLGSKDSAAAAINSAKSLAGTAETFLEQQFTAKGIVVPELADLKMKEANAKILRAESYLSQNNFTLAEKTANEAKSLYQSIISNYAVKQYEVSAYGFAGSLNAALDELLKNKNLKSEAFSLLSRHETLRELRLFEVTEEGRTYYKAVIFITVKNKSASTQTFRIVEVVPKSVADSTLLMNSVYGFNAISSDPIIEFISQVEPNSEKTVSYGFNAEYDQLKADAIIATNSIQQFSSAPLLFSADSSIKVSDFTEYASGVPPVRADLFILIAIIVGILVVIGLIISHQIYFGKEGLAGAKNKMSILEKLESLAKGKGEEKEKRWRYRRD